MRKKSHIGSNVNIYWIDLFCGAGGFPSGYILKGNQTEQKKQIGNAVEVCQATAIATAFNKAVQQHFALAS